MTRHHGKERPPFRAATKASHAGLFSDAAELVFRRIPVLAAYRVAQDTAVTNSKRKQQGHRIESAARALRTALADARIDGHWPQPLSGMFGDRALADLPPTDAPLNGDCAPTYWNELAYSYPDATLQILCESLIPLSAAAQEWSEAPSVISHLRSPRAPRLWFIREMTSLFKRIYGTPLRAPVAALASALFDDPVDASTVNKTTR